MNQLFPIIRRKRRPLLPVESLHDLPPVTNDAAQKKQVTPNMPEKSAGKFGKKAKPTDDEAT